MLIGVIGGIVLAAVITLAVLFVLSRHATPTSIGALSDLNDDELRGLIERWQTEKCVHCGGTHLRACPRVSKMTFEASTTKLTSVEFRADFDDDEVVWPEPLFEEADRRGLDLGEGPTVVD